MSSKESSTVRVAVLLYGGDCVCDILELELWTWTLLDVPVGVTWKDSDGICGNTCLDVCEPEHVLVPVPALLRVSICEGVSVWLRVPVAACVDDRLRVPVLEVVVFCDRVCIMLRVDVDEREDRCENVYEGDVA